MQEDSNPWRLKVPRRPQRAPVRVMYYSIISLVNLTGTSTLILNQFKFIYKLVPNLLSVK
jgi:hypothetical protein